MDGSSTEILDGLDALRSVLGLREVMSLIERTARWVDPKTFDRPPVWYRERARKVHFFKDNWSQPQMNKSRQTGNSIHKMESNTYANEALTLALGMRSSAVQLVVLPYLGCGRRQVPAVEPRRGGSQILLVRRQHGPASHPSETFTDTMPEVKAMLRICTCNLCGWPCDHDSVLAGNSALDGWSDWDAYPQSWPRRPREKNPLGVVAFSPTIENAA